MNKWKSIKEKDSKELLPVFKDFEDLVIGDQFLTLDEKGNPIWHDV